MSCCTARTFLLTICSFQLLATVQREVFDFLGYMWAPILGNFFQIICVLLGIFGIYHFRPKYLAVYCIWSFIWIGWNVFIICLYLEVGILRIESDILNLGTGSFSWWAINGLGCKLMSNYSSSTEADRIQFSTPPTAIEGCLIQYYYIECIQAGIQCLLALFGFIGAAYVIYIYSEEDDSSMRRNTNGLPYSIEYNTSINQDINGTLYQRPMTPRKVKRRSTRSKRGSYRQSYYQNPVTKIMNRSMETSSNDSYHHHPHTMHHNMNAFPQQPQRNSYPGHSNPTYTGSQPNSRAPSLAYLNVPHDPRLNPIYVNDSETVI